MKTYRVAAIILLLSLVCLAGLSAQELPEKPEDYLGRGVSVRTAGGGSFQGTLVRITDDRIEIVIADGQILQIARSELVDMALLDDRGGARSFYEDSASNRLIVMPTGFPMDRGEFQIADQEIVAVTGSYGINEWLSVWGGVSIPGALFSLRGSLAIGERVGVSVGSFVGASWFDLDLGPLVLPYALASVGENNNNVTVGSGFAMTFNDGFDIPGAVLAVGGKRTLTAGTAIVTENWIIWAKRNRTDPITLVPSEEWSAMPLIIAPSAAFRIANNRLSWDIGAVVPFIIDGNRVDGYYLNDPVFPIPILSLTYRIR